MSIICKYNESIHDSNHGDVGRKVSTVVGACDIPAAVQTVNVATQTSSKNVHEAVVKTDGERTTVSGCLQKDYDQNIKFYTGPSSWLVFCMY